jgi:antitoxin StbD
MNRIFQRVEAELAVSMSDLKRNPSAVVIAAQEQAVAILNHNKVVGYLISPEVWEYAQELHDDIKTIENLQKLKPGKPVRVTLDEL